MSDRDIDIICMGRAAVDFYSNQIGASLENAATFSKYVGGCPANISIGTARLGLKSAMLSRVGDEAMGRFLRETLQEEGVDVTHLTTDTERLTGLVLLGITPPDRFPLIFYRENCADMAIETTDYTDEFLARAQAILVTGTHCSKNDIFNVTKDAVRRAALQGTKVILDIDYRPVLWGKTGHGGGEERYRQDELFADRISEILPYCDLVVGTEEEILAAANYCDVDKALSYLGETTSGVIVRKCGENGCVAYERNSSEPIIGRPFPVDVLNVLGAGDAFMSGFLRGYLRGHSLRDCCTFANANGALVVTRHGCSPEMPFWEELTKFMHCPSDLTVVDHMHRKIGQAKNTDRLFVFAFDHRKYFEDLADAFNRPREDIATFKTFIYEAIRIFNDQNRDLQIGLIADGQYSRNALNDADSCGMRVFRCIEDSNAYPLQFIDDHEAAFLLRDWPTHQIIKVLCYVGEQQEQQLKKLRDLHAAAKQTGHELLIEFVDRDSDSLVRVVKMVEACYSYGISPSWWKLQPIVDEESWKRIESLCDEHDPYLHGILLLGENRPIEELIVNLREVMEGNKIIRGFAVGRSIWGIAAQEWFDNRINGEEAIQKIYNNMEMLTQQEVCV